MRAFLISRQLRSRQACSAKRSWTGWTCVSAAVT